MTCGIVLAGGASSRMGQPKALLPIGATTMAERLFALFEPHCDRMALVTGAHHFEIAAALPQFASSIVFNEQHATGMFSSLRKGLDSFPDADSILFSPVDYAGIRASSVACLFEAPEAQVVKTRWMGQSGHPVLIRSEAIQALRAAAATDNAKRILSQFPAVYVDVDDPCVAEDCDTPDDYARLLVRFEAQA